MKFDMQKPCKDCPFLEGKSYLTKGRVREIIRSITAQQATFACHKTIEHDEDGGGRETKDTQHCAGALIFLERMDQPNQLMRIMERLGAYDRTNLAMDAPIYASAKAMVAGHGDRRAIHPLNATPSQEQTDA